MIRALRLSKDPSDQQVFIIAYTLSGIAEIAV
jgi:hypothetical protein